MAKRIWIVPNNDLEAQTIIKLLKKNNERVIITNQQWGASWENIESETKALLASRKKKVIEKIEIPEEEYTMKTKGTWVMSGKISFSSGAFNGSASKEKTIEYRGTREEYLLADQTVEYVEKSGWPYSGILTRGEFHAYREREVEVLDTDGVYGVELQGESPYHNIDHHKYGDDDRTNPKSSLEQVADILGVDLNLKEQFIAANDKGYIPAMLRLGKNLGMTDPEIQKMVEEIRMEERKIQGITKEQEDQAKEAIEGLGDLSEKRKYIELDLPHSKTATVTDRLFGKYDELLIISADGETNFFGSTEIINMLNEKFPGGWSGGELDKGSGFWGGYADQEQIRKAVREMVEQIERREEEEKNKPEIAENQEEESQEESKNTKTSKLAEIRKLVKRFIGKS